MEPWHCPLPRPAASSIRRFKIAGKNKQMGVFPEPPSTLMFCTPRHGALPRSERFSESPPPQASLDHDLGSLYKLPLPVQTKSDFKTGSSSTSFPTTSAQEFCIPLSPSISKWYTWKTCIDGHSNKQQSYNVSLTLHIPKSNADWPVAKYTDKDFRHVPNTTV